MRLPRLLFVVAASLLLFAAASAVAATYYVSPTRDDGTPARAQAPHGKSAILVWAPPAGRPADIGIGVREPAATGGPQ